jgi:hypothetical protein
MAGNISCPLCGATVQLPEEFQGRHVRCPKCQAEFVARPPTDITATPPKASWPSGSAAIQTELPASTESAPARSSWSRYGSADDSDTLADRIVSRGEFRPGGGLAVGTKLMLSLNLLLSVVSFGSDYLQYNLANRLVAGEDVPFAELNSNDARQMMLGLIHIGVYLVTVIFFVMWFYRAHANLGPLGAQEVTYTSGWAAGCWFVPFLNLYRPVQIAQEIWRNSEPALQPEGYTFVRPSTGSALVGFWWAGWLISNLIGNIATRMVWAVNSPSSLLAATSVSMVAEVASIVAAVLALAVVSSLDARQTARAEMLHSATGLSHNSDEYL